MGLELVVAEDDSPATTKVGAGHQFDVSPSEICHLGFAAMS
jgi:hypothetical protein